MVLVRFGVTLFEKEENPLPFGFTGHSKEAIPGLYHAGAREYDSRSGRFLTRDQYRYMDYKDSLSLNLYQYAKGNPLRYVDYDGHMCIEEPSYMERTIDYVIKGNYTDDATVLGLRINVVLGIFGADLIGDLRDFLADLSVNLDTTDLRVAAIYLENFIFWSCFGLVSS